ncbi:hypothetical protein ACIBG4_21815 [Nonomuraea sp. NPDC050383]|uniref:hypothetical protein n=1 Tax=Nonomuraea sp. NPDC050383 TaxID=3364362 RepID=UPI0037B17DEE
MSDVHLGLLPGQQGVSGAFATDRRGGGEAKAAGAGGSQHLAKLRLAGPVKGRREGTFVSYSAADEHVRRLPTQGLFHADHIDRGDEVPAATGRPARAAF